MEGWAGTRVEELVEGRLPRRLPFVLSPLSWLRYATYGAAWPPGVERLAVEGGRIVVEWTKPYRWPWKTSLQILHLRISRDESSFFWRFDGSEEVDESEARRRMDR